MKHNHLITKLRDEYTRIIPIGKHFRVGLFNPPNMVMFYPVEFQNKRYALRWQKELASFLASIVKKNKP